jgi:hypothetical protein
MMRSSRVAFAFPRPVSVASAKFILHYLRTKQAPESLACLSLVIVGRCGHQLWGLECYRIDDPFLGPIMTAEELRAARQAQPFRPFTIHLADGKTFHVAHRDFVSQSPGGRTIIIYGPGEAFSIVDLLLVTELEFQSSAADQGKD